ncbi:hypothetical protein B0H16DRAFT_1476417 [Mycena metata]|uniref:Uncharacterized protein n=1 Tax=Mycena metata TaxID=1033252 RepID=A0AAD7HC88_9AGAR|nr:hypothetical protein B0H16DRAFT_1476417 [Mycena metata]
MSKNGDDSEVLTRRCCALRRVAPRGLKTTHFHLKTVTLTGIELDYGVVMAPRYRRISYLQRRVEFGDRRVEVGVTRRYRRVKKGGRGEVTIHFAASLPHHRRVQLFFVADNLNVEEAIHSHSTTIPYPYIVRRSSTIVVTICPLQDANGAVQKIEPPRHRRVRAVSTLTRRSVLAQNYAILFKSLGGFEQPASGSLTPGRNGMGLALEFIPASTHGFILQKGH